MVNLVIIGEVFLAVLLALAGYLYYTGAEEFCQRMVTRSDTLRQPWRAILYPAWFYKSQRCVWQMRITGIGSMLVSALLTVIAAITILKGAR